MEDVHPREFVVSHKYALGLQIDPRFSAPTSLVDLGKQRARMNEDGGTDIKKEADIQDNIYIFKDEMFVKSSSSSSESIDDSKEVAEVTGFAEATAQSEASNTQSETTILHSDPTPSNIFDTRDAGGRHTPSVGDRDLNPFPGINPFPQVYPSMNTNDLFSRGSVMPGNEIGPSHPIFDPRSAVFDGDRFLQPRFDPFGSIESGNRFLQPRFDPFGPVSGSNGPDFGNPGGRFGRGRGFEGGGRRPPTQFPGEPNPDHLRPPGYDGDSI